MYYVHTMQCTITKRKKPQHQFNDIKIKKNKNYQKKVKKIESLKVL